MSLNYLTFLPLNGLCLKFPVGILLWDVTPRDARVKSSSDVYLFHEQKNLSSKEFDVVEFCQHSFQLSKRLLRSQMKAKLKSNIGSIKDLILAEISHDIIELPEKEVGAQPPSSTALPLSMYFF